MKRRLTLFVAGLCLMVPLAACSSEPEATDTVTPDAEELVDEATDSENSVDNGDSEPSGE